MMEYVRLRFRVYPDLRRHSFLRVSRRAFLLSLRLREGASIPSFTEGRGSVGRNIKSSTDAKLCEPVFLRMYF